MTSATEIRTQRQRQLQKQWQRQRRQGNNWNNNNVLYLRNPDDSSIPNMIVDTKYDKYDKYDKDDKYDKQRPTKNNEQRQTMTNDK